MVAKNIFLPAGVFRPSHDEWEAHVIRPMDFEMIRPAVGHASAVGTFLDPIFRLAFILRGRTKEALRFRIVFPVRILFVFGFDPIRRHAGRTHVQDRSIYFNRRSLVACRRSN